MPIFEPSNATNKEIIWKSDDLSIVSVNTMGLLTANGSTGSTKIRATTVDGSKEAVCTIDVGIPVTGVSIFELYATILKNMTQQLSVKFTPVNALNKDLTWISDDDSIASVDSSGNVTALADGLCKIEATSEDGGFKARCFITVTSQEVLVENFTLLPTIHKMLIGTEFKLIKTFTPVNPSNKNVTWTSTDGTVASVDSFGNVNALTLGPATIRATTSDGGIIGECAITVHDYISVTGVTIDAFGPIQLNTDINPFVNITPDDASNKKYTLVSSDSTVVKITENYGQYHLESLKEGTSTITVNTEDGNFSDSYDLVITSDTNPPFFFMNSFLSSTSFLIASNEELDAVSAEDTSNYTITGSINSIASCVLKPDNRTIQLTLNDPLSDLDTLTLTIVGVKDKLNNASLSQSLDLTYHNPPAALNVEKIIFSANRIYGNPGAGVSKTWVDYGSGLNPTNFVYIFNENILPSSYPLSASIINNDGSFDFAMNLDGSKETVFPNGSYDIYVTDQRSFSEKVTITLP